MIVCGTCGVKRRSGNSCRSCGAVDLDRLRSVQISPSAMPTRRNAIAPRRPEADSFAKGIRKDERGVPYLDTNGKQLRMKESFDPKSYGASDSSIKVSTGGNS